MVPRSVPATGVALEPFGPADGVGRALVAAALEAAFGALGFRREGFLRDKWRVGNEYWNTLIMSLLDDEWRRRKES